MCTCDIGGSSDFYSVTYPRTRPERQCEECLEIIKPGDQYARHTQKHEGDIVSNVLCVDCDAWCEAFSAAQRRECGCSGWAFGSMWDVIREFTEEHLGYDPQTGEKRTSMREYKRQMNEKAKRFGMKPVYAEAET